MLRRVGPQHPRHSPSHLHLPSLPAAIIPPTSPTSATPGRGERRRKEARVTSRRRFAVLVPVSRWTPSSAGSTLITLMGQGSAGSAPGEAPWRPYSPPGRPKPMTYCQDSRCITGVVVPPGAGQGWGGRGRELSREKETKGGG